MRGTGLLLDIIFPVYCVSCGIPVSSRTRGLCGRCLKTLSFAENSCPLCSGLLGSSVCTICSDRMFYPSKHISVFEYEGAVKSIIHALKFGGLKNVYRILTPFLAERLPEFGGEIDVITSVPMNRRKYAERGYNQSELFARSLSEHSGIPFARLLREKGDSISQRNFSYTSRYINVIDRYETLNKDKFREKTVLVTDDVFTTGATVNECARQLLTSGASAVFSLTVARSDLKKIENI